MSQRTLHSLAFLAGLLFLTLLFTRDELRRERRLPVAGKASSPESPPLAIRRAVPRAKPPAVKMPDVRVGLTSGPVASFTLEVAGGFALHSQGKSQKLGKVAVTRVTASSRGITINGKLWPTSLVELVPDASPAIWVNDHLYRGRLRIHRIGSKVYPINVLPLENYIAAVVDGEMPAAFPLEARKAQATAARTFALYQAQAVPADSLAELTAGVRSQKYLGYQYRDKGRLLAGETEAGRTAAAETRGLVCTLKGNLFCTYYSAVCGGRTTLGTEVFEDASSTLQSVPCTWCREAGRYRWSVEVPRAEAQTALQKLATGRGKSLGKLKTVQATSTTPGRIPQFEVRGDKQTLSVNGTELRAAFSSLGVNSPKFSVKDKPAALLLTGQGHGHGVGLCQWGASGLAAEGRTFREILLYYYSGCTLTNLGY